MIQATVCAAVFVCAIEEHVLQAKYNVWQDSKIRFYWHMAWQNLLTALSIFNAVKLEKMYRLR